MLDELMTDAPPRPARVRSTDRRARFGVLSLWLLAAAVVLQVVSLVQQVSYLFAPRPGELPLLVAVLVTAVLVSLSGIVAGCIGATVPDGRRTGVFGAALGLGLLVLFGAASSFGWGFLEALSASV
ncbi:hypothetical protein [Agrococcus jenensis]|uniref:Uncharacterized protein n=1 Tax=Agrococcus jenensis TaxID=46353 RepID=A0A3N2AQ05_9MICO|nr:hypothetical protein [Agrococcus jenensis]ROR65124.1 hypothetical protein EDD26_0486 [Agrococcus jenensis]